MIRQICKGAGVFGNQRQPDGVVRRSNLSLFDQGVDYVHCLKGSRYTGGIVIAGAARMTQMCAQIDFQIINTRNNNLNHLDMSVVQG